MKIKEAFDVLGINKESATIAEIKKALKRCALKYHPDRNPSINVHLMQVINSAYDFLKSLNLDIIEIGSSDAINYQYCDLSDELSKIIEQIINLSGVEIEICGCWLWLSGNTKEHKETLKAIGLKWSNTKKMWYFAPSKDKKRRFKSTDMEEIRNTYGSNKIKSSNPKFLNCA